MTATYAPLGSTSKLTSTDEENSALSALENLKQQAFKDWPNQAGFEGLTEQRGPIELSIKGHIPPWAAGSLYRTGPGQSQVTNTKSGTFHISHWFDGLGHTHRFDIEPDKETNNPATVRVYYSSRRQSERVAADIKASGTLRSISFAQRSDPCVGIFGKFMTAFKRRSGSPDVAVTVSANIPLPSSKTPNIILGTDAAVMCELDPRTLEPIRFPAQSVFHPDLKGPMSAAHPEIDPTMGDYINFNLDLGKQPVYRVFQVSGATGQTSILATIPCKASYMHSFFATQNHVILCLPVADYQWSGLKIPLEGNLLDALKPFDPAEKCRWFVVDRHRGRGVIAQFTSPARFFFHSVNAFEADDGTGDIVCELVDYPNRHVIDGFYYDVLLDREGKAAEFWTDEQTARSASPRLVRYRLPVGNGKASKSTSSSLPPAVALPDPILEIPAPHVGDLPTINPNFRFREHRYVYLIVSRGLSTMFDAIAKVDTKTREVLRWEGPQGHTPGEAIFIPRPAVEGESVDEDDGVLLSVVLDGGNKMSYLLCLDAPTMTEIGRAEYWWVWNRGIIATLMTAERYSTFKGT
ncbi:Beta,beta-carotene 9 [Echria macrotheca]|uniref:Beta,beta-carotene 9 n=1 Tax=Echria macrotheca TaxID=438768 RepID=A0AAJ0B7N6_9PEZI|nr:Beta,beta-carotene 9 [Echria macrotheca]